ncbi:hypothetical protein F4778DRAFT_203008 [Xylariomycetidae sp. FL2044]|nr:hypothetical protein F4778DRAFT_203008 [Xylariomycetidae sp. FL2044]
MYPRFYQPFPIPAEETTYGQEPRPRRVHVTAMLAELVPAVACSFITTSYVSQRESLAGTCPGTMNPSFSSQDSPSMFCGRFAQVDSPGLVLCSCLVLGCSLSSYTHRRRDEDQYQTVVFAVWIVWATCIAWTTGISADVIMLGVVPWACCVAMLTSYIGHFVMRRSVLKTRSQYEQFEDEKKSAF